MAQARQTLACSHSVMLNALYKNAILFFFFFFFGISNFFKFKNVKISKKFCVKNFPKRGAVH